MEKLTLRMTVGLDEPNTVSLGRVFVTSHLLLPETPIGQCDLVAKQVAARKCMAEAELGTQRAHALAAFPISAVAAHNLDQPVVVGVSAETGEAVGRHFVLVVCFGNPVQEGEQRDSACAARLECFISSTHGGLLVS